MAEPKSKGIDFLQQISDMGYEVGVDELPDGTYEYQIFDKSKNKFSQFPGIANFDPEKTYQNIDHWREKVVSQGL